MIEFLKHALGLCGEGHPNVIWLFAGGFITSLILIYNKIVGWIMKERPDNEK